MVLSWSWYEEALSRYNTSKNGMMKLLIKSQPLDSATEKRYNDIKKLVYYIESQLLQVSKALDEQWDKFQDYVKKTHRVQTPTMEAIYQAMVRQNAISQKQVSICTYNEEVFMHYCILCAYCFVFFKGVQYF